MLILEFVDNISKSSIILVSVDRPNRLISELIYSYLFIGYTIINIINFMILNAD